MRYDIPWVYAEVGQQVEPVSESKTNADRAVANDWLHSQQPSEVKEFLAVRGAAPVKNGVLNAELWLHSFSGDEISVIGGSIMSVNWFQLISRRAS